MSVRKGPWVRGSVVLVILGGLVAATMMSPVGAAFDPSKGKIKSIAKKQATKVFKKKSGGLEDACPAGTVLFAGICMEQTSRGPAQWFEAGEACAAAGRRLPSPHELLTWQASGNNLDGDSPDQGEWTSDLTFEGGVAAWHIREGGGIFATGPPQDFSRPYRCVASLTNV